MFRILLSITLSLLASNSISACGCGGPPHNLGEDVERSGAIFIGVIEKMNKEDLFHLVDGRGEGLDFINFRILKSHKGLNEAQLRVSVFDHFSNSSCSGLLANKAIGDTVLVFARMFDKYHRFLFGNLCSRHTTFQKISQKEQYFMDTARWTDPRKIRQDWGELSLSDTLRKETEENIKHCYSNNNFLLKVGLAISAFLNILLLILVCQNATQNQNFLPKCPT